MVGMLYTVNETLAAACTYRWDASTIQLSIRTALCRSKIPCGFEKVNVRCSIDFNGDLVGGRLLLLEVAESQVPGSKRYSGYFGVVERSLCMIQGIEGNVPNV